MNLQLFLLTMLAAGHLAVLPTPVLAQMPGMEPPKKADPPASTAQPPAGQTKALPEETGRGDADIGLDGSPGTLIRYWTRFMAPESPYRGLILVVLTLLILLNLKAYLTRLMRQKTPGAGVHRTECDELPEGLAYPLEVCNLRFGYHGVVRVSETAGLNRRVLRDDVGLVVAAGDRHRCMAYDHPQEAV